MHEQFSLSYSTESNTVDIIRSNQIILGIRPMIDSVLKLFNLSPRHVAEYPLTEKGKQVGISLTFSIAPSALIDASSTKSTAQSNLICRIKDQVSQSYLEFPSDHSVHYSEVGEITKIGASPNFLRINLNSQPDISKIAHAVCSDIDSLLRIFPSDFSCCHLYKECSAAGKCIAENQDFACGCYYKRNLMAGKNFYKD